MPQLDPHVFPIAGVAALLPASLAIYGIVGKNRRLFRIGATSAAAVVLLFIGYAAIQLAIGFERMSAIYLAIALSLITGYLVSLVAKS